MPTCIECGYPVHQLYTIYSKADDRALGKGVKLTQCPRCKQFADKYVEHDFVVLFIDLVLIKPQVYRHLLFNRLEREDDKLDPYIARLGVLLLLFDVYLTWARIERASPQTIQDIGNSFLANGFAGSSTSASRVHSQQPPPNPFSNQAILLQYLFFLLLCSLETLLFHLPIRFLAPYLVSSKCPGPNRISTAILVSSCTKLFPILMVIWDYDLPSSASAVSWAVIVNNVAALAILLDCGYFIAALLACVGAAARALVGGTLLNLAGLGVAEITTATLLGAQGPDGLWRWFGRSIGLF